MLWANFIKSKTSFQVIPRAFIRLVITSSVWCLTGSTFFRGTPVRISCINFDIILGLDGEVLTNMVDGLAGRSLDSFLVASLAEPSSIFSLSQCYKVTLTNEQNLLFGRIWRMTIKIIQSSFLITFFYSFSHLEKIGLNEEIPLRSWIGKNVFC